ncbi:hypothetical protein B0H10DRAFT_1953585 [Mycena sp. CBHHK59/15]|nr:hypothetical protein B0H10DRAFT_1953585 [Mycena sp. CBHHK59/15]
MVAEFTASELKKVSSGPILDHNSGVAMLGTISSGKLPDIEMLPARPSAPSGPADIDIRDSAQPFPDVECTPSSDDSPTVSTGSRKHKQMEEQQQQQQPEPELGAEHGSTAEYDIEKILKVQNTHSGKKYLVSFTDYEIPEWVHESDLSDGGEALLTTFYQSAAANKPEYGSDDGDDGDDSQYGKDDEYKQSTEKKRETVVTRIIRPAPVTLAGNTTCLESLFDAKHSAAEVDETLIQILLYQPSFPTRTPSFPPCALPYPKYRIFRESSAACAFFAVPAVISDSDALIPLLHPPFPSHTPNIAFLRESSAAAVFFGEIL